jgi:hypothetical protein
MSLAATAVPDSHISIDISIKLLRPIMTIVEDSVLDVLGLLLDSIEIVSINVGRF